MFTSAAPAALSGDSAAIASASLTAYDGRDAEITYGDLDQLLDFLPNLETNSDVAACQLAQPSHKQSCQKQHNKLIQKRYRERQKARAHTVEAQLAETTAELTALRTRQQQLEQAQRQLAARNMLLEKVASLNKQNCQGFSKPAQAISDKLQSTLQVEMLHCVDFPDVPSNCIDSDAKSQTDIQRLLAGVTRTSDKGEVVTLTVDEQLHVLTVEESGQVSVSDCCEIYTMYAQKLGACLLELDEHENGAALHRLQTWMVELTTLGACITYSNPDLLKTISSFSLDSAYTQTPVQQLCDSFYATILDAVNLTDTQVQDLLYLRGLFRGKSSQILEDRKKLLSMLSSVSAGNGHVSDKMTGMTALSEQLRENASDEYRVSMQLTSVMFRGIWTSRQVAVQVVHAYPYILDKPRLLDVLAAHRGQVHMQIAPEVDSLQHAANWQQVEDYLHRFTPVDLHRHVPFT